MTKYLFLYEKNSFNLELILGMVYNLIGNTLCSDISVSERKEFFMVDTRTTKNAVYLIDDDMVRTTNHPVPSGWDYDNRGAINPAVHQFGRSFNISTDKEHNAPVSMKRDFLPLRSGKANFAFTMHLKSGDGFYLNFYDIDGNVALTLKQKGHSLVCGDTVIPAPFLYGMQYITIEFDIDEKLAVLSLSGRECAWLPLSGNSLASLKMGYEADAEGEFTIYKVVLNINYLVCDRNWNPVHNADMPDDWVVYAEGNANAFTSTYYEGKPETTYALHAQNGSSVTAYHPFEKTGGKVCFELKYLSKGDGDNIIMCLTLGEDDVVSVVDTGTYSQSASGTLLRKHSPYVWQFMRIEADTATKKALIKHNGVKCGEIDFDIDADSFDGISITYAPENDGYMRFTDVLAFVIQPEPEDYPKPPVRPTMKNGYTTGINVCSLWRNGEHWGWDAISSFEANKTFLGYYDEPLTEVADWEIKWMVEHGINAQFYCWFDNQTDAPIFKTHICGALDDGYFNAKYCDEMNFALIWEAANASSPNLDGFKKYLVPYWVDHYFSHPNYYRIDGKAVLSIFGLNKAIVSMGGPETFKVAMQYLEDVLKGLGYTGLITMTSGEPSDELYRAGITSVYAYNWGHQSHSFDYVKSRIESQMQQDKLHVVPTACVGYNDVAWREFRSPFTSQEEFGQMLTWMRDDVISKYENDEETWKKKFVMLATWNEYGEGTIMCPSNINGFGYLNEVRRAFTVEGDDFESDRPSDAVLDRLGYLYPRPRAIIQAPLLEKTYSDEGDLLFKLEFDTQEKIDKWEFSGEGFIELRDGKLYGESTGTDPKFVTQVDFDAEDVAIIKFKIRAKNGLSDFSNATAKTANLMCHYITDEDGEWHYNKQLNPRDYDGEYAVLMPCDDPKWTGRIKAFRFDPCDNQGMFEVEEILFISGDKSIIETYIDENHYKSHHKSKLIDGEAYVPFEPLRDFCVLTHIYHEWKVETRTLMIQKDDVKSYWREGSDIVKLSDGREIKLKKPLSFYDNLPMIQLSVFCELMGYKYEASGNRIDITTK